MKGRLVPFLGAGMSAGRLTMWDTFVKNLEDEAGIPYKKPPKLNNDVRAQRACTSIRNSRGRKCFWEAVGKALTPKDCPKEIPSQTTKLAAINWPLVVSTNYDDLYFGACLAKNAAQAEGELDVQVLGRSPRDCKVVLSSLHGPFDRQYIWHVQGFLGGQFGGEIENTVSNLEDLRDQMVVGHSEYRVVTNASPHFRRCFGEMFISRSFLFLGSSLSEEYFLNLFGEALDLCGPSDLPHFALALQGTVNAHFLADQMNITVCEFKHYEELPEMLGRLRDAIADAPVRSTGWSYTVGITPECKVDLEIVREEAPLRPNSEEVVALVARRDSNDRPVLEGKFAALDREHHCLEKIGNHTVKYGAAEIYAVTARCKGDEDDSAVDEAVREFLDEMDRRFRTMCDERKTIHLQLSSTGGTVPPVFAFIRVVRSFGEWIRHGEKRHQRRSVRLVLHTQADVEFNLTSGRIDVQELLSSELIRFWAVVSSDKNKEPVRRVLHYAEETKLSEVLKEIGVPFGKSSAQWSVSVCPSPRKSPEAKNTTWSLAESNPEPTLASIGVVFGSVLALECTGVTGCPVRVPAGELKVLDIAESVTV
ncbi:MAG TPA: SIR2 family protein [Bryobacteraceae bacterium]